MKLQHLAWIVAQIAVGGAMINLVFYTVTGLGWWFFLNLSAGVLAILAGALWSKHRLCFQLSSAAAALYAPVNLAFGLAILARGDASWIPWSLVGLSLLQVLLAFGAYRHRNGF